MPAGLAQELRGVEVRAEARVKDERRPGLEQHEMFRRDGGTAFDAQRGEQVGVSRVFVWLERVREALEEHRLDFDDQEHVNRIGTRSSAARGTEELVRRRDFVELFCRLLRGVLVGVVANREAAVRFPNLLWRRRGTVRGQPEGGEGLGSNKQEKRQT